MSKSQRRVQLATALTALLLSLPAAAATYRVYPVPVEAPTFTAPAPPADARVLLIDPAGTASPFGWHDVDGVAGVEFTVMRGNNVHAYEDLDANGQPPAVEHGGTRAQLDGQPVGPELDLERQSGGPVPPRCRAQRGDGSRRGGRHGGLAGSRVGKSGPDGTVGGILRRHGYPTAG